MESLKDKIKQANALVDREIPRHNQFCVLCSFGKDSLVLLHLFLQRKIYPPVVFYRDPWFSRKYDFANKVISDLGLTVYDYPPIRVSMLYGKGIAAFTNEYHAGGIVTVAVPKNIIEYDPEAIDTKFLCGVSFFTRPCGTFNFPWDLAFLGHKDVDEDQIYGAVPLKNDVVYRDIGPNYAYPLKEWTHDDVWDYIEEFDVPVQRDRYDVANRREWPDKTFNSDYWPACIRCLDKRLVGQKVFCPKARREIQNVSEQVPEFAWEPDYFSTDLFGEKHAT